MERIGRWLASRSLKTADPQEIEDRVEAVIARVDSLEHRIHALEHADRPRGDWNDDSSK